MCVKSTEYLFQDFIMHLLLMKSSIMPVNMEFLMKSALISPVQISLSNSLSSITLLIADKVECKSLVSEVAVLGSVGKYELIKRILFLEVDRIMAWTLQCAGETSFTCCFIYVWYSNEHTVFGSSIQIILNSLFKKQPCIRKAFF